jgi:hypothetical protein
LRKTLLPESAVGRVAGRCGIGLLGGHVIQVAGRRAQIGRLALDQSVVDVHRRDAGQGQAVAVQHQVVIAVQPQVAIGAVAHHQHVPGGHAGLEGNGRFEVLLNPIKCRLSQGFRRGLGAQGFRQVDELPGGLGLVQQDQARHRANGQGFGDGRGWRQAQAVVQAGGLAQRVVQQGHVQWAVNVAAQPNLVARPVGLQHLVKPDHRLHRRHRHRAGRWLSKLKL